MELKYKNQNCYLKVRRYPKVGNVSLSIISKDTNKLLTVATINPRVYIADAHLAIKDFSEDKELFKALKEGNIITRIVHFINSSDMKFKVYDTTTEFKKFVNSKLEERKLPNKS